MAVIKNEKTGKWEVRTYYEDWTGERKQKTKRGFEKKQDAVEWERAFKLQKHYDMSMTFSDFVEVYSNDMKPRLRLNTWNSKEHIIRTNRRTQTGVFLLQKKTAYSLPERQLVTDVLRVWRFSYA